LRIDLAHWRTPLVVFDRIRQLKQLPLGCPGRGERAIFLEFHLWSITRLCEDHISHDQSYHRDKEHQWYSRVDGEHDHRRTVIFEHDQHFDIKRRAGQAHVEGYC
jgi:hypothetical protein